MEIINFTVPSSQSGIDAWGLGASFKHMGMGEGVRELLSFPNKSTSLHTHHSISSSFIKKGAQAAFPAGNGTAWPGQQQEPAIKSAAELSPGRGIWKLGT